MVVRAGWPRCPNTSQNTGQAPKEKSSSSIFFALSAGSGLSSSGHSRKIAFHITHEDRDAYPAELFRQNAKGRRFSRTRCTGDKTMAVPHFGKDSDLLRSFANDQRLCIIQHEASHTRHGGDKKSGAETPLLKKLPVRFTDVTEGEEEAERNIVAKSQALRNQIPAAEGAAEGKLSECDASRESHFRWHTCIVGMHNHNAVAPPFHNTGRIQLLPMLPSADPLQRRRPLRFPHVRTLHRSRRRGPLRL